MEAATARVNNRGVLITVDVRDASNCGYGAGVGLTDEGVKQVEQLRELYEARIQEYADYSTAPFFTQSWLARQPVRYGQGGGEFRDDPKAYWITDPVCSIALRDAEVRIQLTPWVTGGRRAVPAGEVVFWRTLARTLRNIRK